MHELSHRTLLALTAKELLIANQPNSKDDFGYSMTFLHQREPFSTRAYWIP
jgi:hypothetical protein